jgi:hypothetical protein
MTTVALSMAATPFLGDLGTSLAAQIEKNRETPDRCMIIDAESGETVSNEVGDLMNHVIVFAYGRVGKMVCEMLDERCITYVVVDHNEERVLSARAKGLPVFYTDITNPEALRSFGVTKASVCVLAPADVEVTNKAVEAIRQCNPTVPVFARAKDGEHKTHLETSFPNVRAMSPVLPEDSILLTLPFGGALLQQLGVPKTEIASILVSLLTQIIVQ